MLENQEKVQSSNIAEKTLFVVGDDAQSIYGFRGSSIELILNFEKFYPGAREIILNQNYRSGQPILDLAEQVLTLNPHQKQKNLFTKMDSRDLQVCYYLARNQTNEGEYIVKDLYERYVENTDSHKVELNEPSPNKASHFEETEIRLVTEEDEYKQEQSNPVSNMFDIYLNSEELSDYKPGSRLWSTGDSSNHYNYSSWQVPEVNWNKIENLNNCAILYRTHAQTRAIEEALLKHRVPYRLVSGTRFLDRKEIKDVLAILRYLSNGSDKIALSRFLPLIVSGVGAKTMEKMYAFLEDHEYPLPPKNQIQLADLIQKFTNVWDRHTTLIEMTKDLLNSLGYFTYLKSEYPVKEEFLARSENVAEIYSLMLPFDENKEINLTEKLNQFLGQIMLMTNADSSESTDNSPKINLMTLHQSKGLEFETVYLIGIEDGLLPHQNSLFEPDGLEEEVRLAYVGVTRAKKNLHLIAAESRLLFGQVKSFPISRIFRPFLDKYCKRIVWRR